MNQPNQPLTFTKKLAGPIVGYSDINACIELFQKIKARKEKSVLRIEASATLTDFDILLVSYLMLFKQEQEDLIIQIVLPFNNDRHAGGVIYKLAQYSTYAYLMTQTEVFDLYVANYTTKFSLFENPSTELQGETGNSDQPTLAKKFRSGRFVLSDSFMLLLFITEKNKNLYNLLFIDDQVTSNGTNWYSRGVQLQWFSDQEKTYQYYNKAISLAADPEKHLDCISKLGQLAFLKTLYALDSISYYLSSQTLSNAEVIQLQIRTPRLKYSAAARKRSSLISPPEFFNKIRFIFDELSHKPLVYHFIFVQLISSELLKTKTGLNSAGSIENIIGLWQFTKDLAYGITEMASNTLQHSSTHQGVISARMLAGIMPETLHTTETMLSPLHRRLAEGLMDSGQGLPEGLMDIHIIDLGTKGIIPSMLESSKLMLSRIPADSELYRLIEKDIAMLMNPQTSMADILLPSGKPMLNQQSKRSIAHFGFLIFNKLIRNNHGLIIITSPDHSGQQKSVEDPQLDDTTTADKPLSGTSIGVVLPVSPGWKYKPHIPHRIELPIDSTAEEMKGMEEIFNVRLMLETDSSAIYSSNDILIIPLKIPSETVINREDEWDCFQFIHGQVRSFLADRDPGAVPKIVLNIDLEECVISASQFYRLLGTMEIEYPRMTTIFSNFPFDRFLQLQDLNDGFLEYTQASLPYWSHENITLLYHYITLENNERFYFTDGLWGGCKTNWLHLNSLIHRNHFNASTILNLGELPSSPDSIVKFNSLANNLAFYNRNVLLPFDLILKGGNEYTIFEHNALVLLNNPIKRTAISKDAESMQNLVNGLPGYKIDGTHFKIGTKIHISDFYYAKRFFQNSFYASRFAYLIANDLETLPDKDKTAIRSKGLTLVGYGIYSELLLSLCERFVKRKLGIPEEIVNHNVLLDKGKLEFAKQPILKGRILLIVPIASTFSTSLKMESTIDDSHHGVTILDRHYNLIHVSPYTDKEEPTALEMEFGWGKKDLVRKTIPVNAFYKGDNAPRSQRYFLRLRSEWELIETCRFCYAPLEDGNESWEEKPLMETDQTAVTPALILDYPKSNSPKNRLKQDHFELLPEMVQYGHHSRDQSHFLYLIDTEAFLRKNYPTVNKWLTRLKKSDEFKHNFSEYQNVVLLSSSHYSNAEFINLVNEVLFSSAANVIHYDPANDYIQNFDMIYGLELAMADKIIFVDDSFKSGRTFAKINEFARYTLQVRKELGQSPKGKLAIDACIFLINKSHPYAQMSMSLSISSPDAIYSFANLNLYTSLSHDESSPLQLESEKYHRLTEAAILESLRVHFRMQKEKLETNSPANRNILNLERHLMMLEATHRLYKYFGNSKIKYKLDSFKEFAEDILHETVFLSDFESKCGKKDGMPMFASCLLKVLTQSPFIQFEPVKRSVFRWVEQLLKQQAELVCESIDDNSLTYDQFNDLKFLLRRSVLLNSNKLLKADMLKVIAKLYSANAIPLRLSGANNELSILKRKEKESEKHAGVEATSSTPANQQIEIEKTIKIIDLQLKQLEVSNLEGFSIFFVAQIKELLMMNEARCIHLEQALLSLKDAPELFEHLSVMLRVENSSVVHSLYQFLMEQTDIKEKMLKAGEKVMEKEFISDLFKLPQVLNHQKYKILTSYFIQSGQLPPPENPYLTSYLKIRSYVYIHDNIINKKLSEKTKVIFDELMRICLSPDPVVSVQSLGSFLVIKDNFGTPVPVYDRNENNDSALHQYNLEDKQDQLLQDILDLPDSNPKNYPHTIIELTRNADTGEWLNEQAGPEMERKIKLKRDFLKKDINRLILLKLTNKQGVRSANGMAGFYFKSSARSPGDIYRLQYLALLQETLSQFVEHNHRSTHFREWLRAENQKRFLMLTGHSKEMMHTIITYEPVLKDVAHDFEHVQSLIMFNDNMPKVGGGTNLELRLASFYNIDSRDQINQSYIKTLKSGVKKIYRSQYIENKVSVDVETGPGASEAFTFFANKRILNIIFFELFLNAKKNRWHFLPDDKSPLRSNKVWIFFGVKEADGEKEVTIRVSNTCCNMNHRPDEKEDPMTILKSSTNIKSEYVTSGTALIKELAKEILKGTATFDCKPLPGDPELYVFSAEIIFKEHHL